MSKLYVMVGIPGSGKSTWIKEHLRQDTDVRVSRDEIRFSMLKDNEDYFAKENMVYNEYIRNIQVALGEGKNVFADATHYNINSRKKLFRMLGRNLQGVEIIAVVFQVPLNICISRNNTRTGREKVPEAAIYRMYKEFQMPTFEEGFSKIANIK